MTVQGEQHADSVVIGRAQHERRPSLRQRHQQIVGVGNAVRIGDHGRDVVQRHLSQFLALAFRVAHHHEATIDEQVPPVICDFDDAANHGGQSPNPGSRNSPIGLTTTFRAAAFCSEPACLYV